VTPNPGYSMTDKPQEVINAMDASDYFNMMAKLMGKELASEFMAPTI
jgi:hypothetical protein